MGATRSKHPNTSDWIPPELCVTIPRTVEKDELLQMRQWLEKDVGAQGEYWHTLSHWYRGKPAAMFVFSDPNTACLFKVRWV